MKKKSPDFDLMEYVTKEGERIPMKVGLIPFNNKFPIGVCECSHFHTDHSKDTEYSNMGRCRICNCQEFIMVGFLAETLDKTHRIEEEKKTEKPKRNYAPWTQMSFRFSDTKEEGGLKNNE